MATKETRALRGRRRGLMVVDRAIRELAIARTDAGLSVESLANAAGISKSALSRMLGHDLKDTGVVQLSEVASVLGFEISLGIHPIGDPVRDKGRLAVGRSRSC